jgi:hypothetical protein
MICTEYDQWLKNQDKTVWFVELTHEIGQGDFTAYQDDNRPGEQEPKAWTRLKNFLKEDSEFCVNRFGLMFRDHIEYVPIDHPYCNTNGKGGIYFANGAAGDMLWQHTTNYYVLGVVEGDKVHKYWYRIPEVQLEQETWDPLPDEGDPRLIWNK